MQNREINHFDREPELSKVGQEEQEEQEDKEAQHLLEAFKKVPSPMDLSEVYLKDPILFSDVIRVLNKRASKGDEINITLDLSFDDLGKTPKEKILALRGFESFLHSTEKNQKRTVVIEVTAGDWEEIQKAGVSHSDNKPLHASGITFYEAA
jgi:hypothetical protein